MRNKLVASRGNLRMPEWLLWECFRYWFSLIRMSFQLCYLFWIRWFSLLHMLHLVIKPCQRKMRVYSTVCGILGWSNELSMSSELHICGIYQFLRCYLWSRYVSIWIFLYILSIYLWELFIIESLYRLTIWVLSGPYILLCYLRWAMLDMLTIWMRVLQRWSDFSWGRMFVHWTESSKSSLWRMQRANRLKYHCQWQ